MDIPTCCEMESPWALQSAKAMKEHRFQSEALPSNLAGQSIWSEVGHGHEVAHMVHGPSMVDHDSIKTCSTFGSSVASLGHQWSPAQDDVLHVHTMPSFGDRWELSPCGTRHRLRPYPQLCLKESGVQVPGTQNDSDVH